MDLVNAYHSKNGGPPVFQPASGKKGGKGGKGGKRNASAAFDSPAIEPGAKKRGRKAQNADTNGTDMSGLPEGSWEELVMRIHTVLEEENTSLKGGRKSKGGKTLLGLIEWHDGRKTQHTLATLRTKCPQKLLDYYEQH